MGRKSQQEKAKMNRAMVEQTLRRQRRYHTFEAAGEAMLKAQRKRPFPSRDHLAMCLTGLIALGVLLAHAI